MTEKEHTELLTMYQIAVDDIRDSKHQQWRIIQLTLAAIVVIAGIPSLGGFKDAIPTWCLEFIVWIVGLSGIFFIWSFASSLSKFRDKKKAIREHLGEVVWSIEKESEKSNKMRDFQTSFVFAAVFTLFIILAGYVAVSIIK